MIWYFFILYILLYQWLLLLKEFFNNLINSFSINISYLNFLKQKIIFYLILEKKKIYTMVTKANNIEIDIDSIIEKLLSVRGNKPGK